MAVEQSTSRQQEITPVTQAPAGFQDETVPTYPALGTLNEAGFSYVGTNADGERTYRRPDGMLVNQ